MQHLITAVNSKPLKYMLIAFIFIFMKAEAQKDSWTLQKPSGISITPRYDGVAFTIGDKAYVGSGTTGTVYTKDFWEYDAVSNSWAQKADFAGQARTSAVAFSIGDKGYIGTGKVGNLSTDIRQDLWQYDPAGNTWVRKADVSGARYGAVGFAIGGKGYIATGFDYHVMKGDCWEYDPLTDKWTYKSSGIPRFGAACFTIGDKAYIGTGSRSVYASNVMEKDFWEFNPSDGKWTQIADYGGGARMSATALSIGDKGFVGGGYPNTQSFWEYERDNNRWLPRAMLPAPDINSAVGFSIGDKGYVGLGSSPTISKDIWEYQVEHPANLKAVFTGRNFVNLDWDNINSNGGDLQFDIYVNGIKTYTTSESSITAGNLLPNTSYTFTVKGKYLSGYTSIFSNAVVAKTTSTVSGLNYRYYEGTWNNLPNFNSLVSVKTGKISNVDLNSRREGVNENFGFVWEGYINIPAPGNYTFETVSDDGSKLYFNSFYSPTGAALVNNDGLHGPWSPVAGKVNVPAAGLYPVSITYFEKDGGESMQVYWTGPAGSGITRQLIPDSAFTENFTPSVDTLAPTAPANVKVLSAARNLISLDWDNSTDNSGEVFYDVYVNGLKKYATPVSDIIVDSLSGNSTYTFTIQARDLNGNISGFSNAVAGSTTNVNDGLNYRYYEGTWNSLPDFNLLSPVKTGLTPNVDISLRPQGVNDNFGFVWEGYINIPVPGNYTFETVSDDGSKFYFNSLYSPTAVAVVNNDGLHGPWSPVAGTVNVPNAGVYPVAITFFERGSGESMQVYWTGPAGSGITRQLIPASAFKDHSSSIDTLSPGVPANVAVVSTARNIIGIDWDNSPDNAGIAYYDVYVNGILKYSTPVSEIIADSLVESTTYTFTIRARDIAGNVSGFSDAVTGTTSNVNNGLNYRYYEGNWNNLPDFTLLTPVKTGITPNVDISVRPAGVNDNFGFVWEGYINIPAPGKYIFETMSDDGSKFYFNSFYSSSAAALVNNDGLHGPWSPASGTINIASAGQYPVAVTFFEKGSGESMQLYWTGPAGSGITRQLIPDSAFTGNYKPSIDTSPPSAPVNLKVIVANSDNIHLKWDDATDDRGVMRYDVYANGVKMYTNTSSEIIADNLYADRLYSFTVKAIDHSGNSSPFSLVLNVRTASTTNGLGYRYFEGVWDRLPVFNTISPVKTGTSAFPDISKRPAGRNDHFAFLWEGYIHIPTPGNYTFETVSDDGSMLYLFTFYYPGIKPLVINDGLHAATSSSGTVNFSTAGAYPITISYFEKDGGEKMEVYWTGPGIPRQLIPNTAFVPYGSNYSYSAIQKNIATPAQIDTSGSSEVQGITKLYPNPFRESFTIDFTNSAAGNVISVGVFDLTGRLILNRYVGAVSAGKNLITVKVKESLQPGMYIVKLNVNGKVSKTLKLVKL